jgi:hypothetical protein
VANEKFLEFLSQKAATGSPMGEGSFSLDAARAILKLGSFALANPGTWVVKFVQAAVAAGAPEVRFTFTRRTVRVRFENVACWQADSILRNLQHAGTPEDRSLRHLQTGLLAAVAAEGVFETVSWSCGAKRVCLKRQEVVVEDCPVQSQVVIEAKRLGKPTQKADVWESPVRYLFKRAAHEYKELVERCRCSPIPIFVDEYRLRSGYNVPPESMPTTPDIPATAFNGLNLPLGLVPLTCFPDRTSPAYPPGDTQVTSTSDDQVFAPAVLPAQADGSEINGVMAIYCVRCRKSRVNYLLDGAFVGRQEIDDPQSTPDETFSHEFSRALRTGEEHFAFDLYLQTDESKLDLSQFQVREISSAEIQKRILPPLTDFLIQVESRCDKPWQTQKPERLSISEWKNMPTSQLVVSGFVLPVLPYVLVWKGLEKLASVSNRLLNPWKDKRKIDKLKKALDATIQALKKLAGDQHPGGL